jgi:hypothetical protein
MRVSAFIFLYRVLRQGVALPEAESDLHAVWQPDKVWSRFIQEELTAFDRARSSSSPPP